MRILSHAIHGILDYVFVFALILTPIAVGLSSLAAAILYSLAAVCLVMTLITTFPPGSIKVLQFSMHLHIELIIGMSMLVCPWIFGFARDPSALAVYTAGGFTLLLLRLLTKPI